MKKLGLYRFLQIAIVVVMFFSVACSGTTNNNADGTETEQEIENTTPETEEALWDKTKTENTYLGYRKFLEKYPNDTEALKNIFKTNKFKTKYGNFLKFFDKLKLFKNDYSGYFANFSKNSCTMNNESVNYPYTENHFNKYQHQKLCAEAEITEFPGLDSYDVFIDINDKGILWRHQFVGAGASVMVYIEWEFENKMLVITKSEIEIDYFNEGEEAYVEISEESSDCKREYEPGVVDARGFYENTGLNASWSIYFTGEEFVALYTKDGKQDSEIIIDQLEKISDCEYSILMKGIQGEHAKKWRLRYNTEKKFYDLITLTYDAGLEAWIDVDFGGSNENG